MAVHLNRQTSANKETFSSQKIDNVPVSMNTEQPQLTLERDSRSSALGNASGIGALLPPPCNYFGIQAKLTIGSPDDKYEREADHIAEQVMRMSEPVVQTSRLHEEEMLQPSQNTPFFQRKCTKCEEELKEKIQTKSENGSQAQASSELASKINNASGNGQPIDKDTRSFMENRFSLNFSNVRIHTGSNAHNLNNQLQSRAFTFGTDIFFNNGEYDTGSRQGKQLIAHELAHVVQQGGSRKLVQREGGVRMLPVETFSGLWQEFLLAKQRNDSQNALQLALRLSNISASLEDSRQYGLELGIYLLQNGELTAAKKVLANYESFVWIRFISIDKKDLGKVLYEDFNIDSLLQQAENLARQSSFPDAIQILTLITFYAQVNISILSKRNPFDEVFANKMHELIGQLDPSLSARESRRQMEDILRIGQFSTALPRVAKYSNLTNAYDLLRNAHTLFLRLQREAIMNNDTTHASTYALQHQKYVAALRQRHLMFDSPGITMESSEAFNTRGDVGYTIYGANDATEVVTPLPGTATPAELGFFPLYTSDLNVIMNSMAGQSKLINDLLAMPQVRSAFPSGEINMQNTDTRINVWKLAFQYLASSMSAPNALDAIIGLIERFFKYFTVHTEYNIRDFGVSYLSTTFPTDLIGRAVRDCGVYALTAAYEVYRVARSASPRLNLRFQLYSMLEHVILVIRDDDNKRHYIVNNNEIAGPNNGDVLQDVGGQYAKTFQRGFAITPSLDISLGDSSMTDTNFRNQAWVNYQAATSWGLTPESPTGADDIRTLEQRSRDAYIHYYERISEFDRIANLVQRRLNWIRDQVISEPVAKRADKLKSYITEQNITLLINSLYSIFMYYGPQAASSNVIAVDNRTPQHIQRNVVNRQSTYLYSVPEGSGIHPLVRFARAIILLNHIGMPIPAGLNAAYVTFIQNLRLVPNFGQNITQFEKTIASGISVDDLIIQVLAN